MFGTRWSTSIGRPFGIDVRLHVTFVILMAILGVASLLNGGVAAALGVGSVMALVFGCVVLHELGHALVARRFGVATRQIVLYPIGGVAQLESEVGRPRQEVLVALAGPAVNIAIALSIVLVAGATAPFGIVAPAFTSSGLLQSLLWINVSLALFNLLPAFPMDGGRVLRGLLATRIGRLRATRIAVGAGQALAGVFVVLGFFGSPMLILIGAVVYLAGQSELEQMEARAAFLGPPSGGDEPFAGAARVVVEPSTTPAARLIEPSARIVAPGDALRIPETYRSAGLQADFAVLEAGRLVGLLTREDLSRGLRAYTPDAPVAWAMRIHFPVLRPEASPREALAAMLLSAASALPVAAGERLLGIVTRERLIPLLGTRSA